MSTDEKLPAFQSLGLAAPLLKALQQLGYETPSPIQAECIPLLMEGHDLVGQAQTGTGKTAAFALPLLGRVNVGSAVTQILVLAPTRELAIQVAEACQSYAKYLNNFHVLPIYGGSSYSTQLRQLKRGVQVVVGTPGRVMDHMRRGTLKLDQLKALVLDEADEMLRMGFIDDVEWVLGHTPDDCQIALFSATMPKEIRKVAQKYLKEPKEIKIASKTSTATTIKQRYLQVNNNAQKLDAMTRILESETFDGIITFVRTKIATTELADKLSARGYAAEALNGDVPQARREQIVAQLKAGKLDILVATDVAARGLDVERISHVINYDIPTDTEAYVHRIGRTGRAGRSGEAILFVNQREQRLLRAIERATKQSIERMRLPSSRDIYETRVAKFKQRISDTINNEDLVFFQQLIADFQKDNEVTAETIASALAFLAQGSQSLQLKDIPEQKSSKPVDDPRDRPRKRSSDLDERPRQDRHDKSRTQHKDFSGVSTEAKPLKDFPEVDMCRYRVDVGYQHEVKPGNLVGAIANEAGLESRYIGHIEIYDDFSTVDLPDGMPKEILKVLKNTWVCQQKLNITPMSDTVRGSKPEFKSKARSEPRKTRQKNTQKPDKGKKFSKSDKRD
ncbi:MAG: DEAD/DEAH box helicase [Porticoccaceae bacterium]|nr:DEAD/DEAH box helicase [Pseudomonadales bacterium]MCP5170819.1 DEAD/DEAH box helicase [Pseudomonadales bacterium]MCP5301941.1 DEAD/DEAH box helicase [Pseudomonadales bacterium]